MKSGDLVEITDMYYLGKHPRNHSGVVLSENPNGEWILVKLDMPYADSGNTVARQWFRKGQLKSKEPEFVEVVTEEAMSEYEITVVMPNGDWVWCRQACPDFHEACLSGIQLANERGARLHHIALVPTV